MKRKSHSNGVCTSNRAHPISPSDNLSNQISKLVQWPIADIVYHQPPEPHQVVFWSSTWGVNITRLVWIFCNQIQWPCPSTPRHKDDTGIRQNWLCLLCNIHNVIPQSRFGQVKFGLHNECTDPVQMLPTEFPRETYRVVSESFR